jgi:hypothetical protein
MADTPQNKAPEPEMDPKSLYREEIFTDRKMGTIRRLVPVKDDGATDTARATLYIGEAQILTPMGTLPLNFEIPAQSLQEAISKFGPATKQAIDHAMQELKELRRQASSSIVVPQGGVGPLGPGGLPGGGLPGGGKIKLP